MISVLTVNALATKPSPIKRLTRVHLQHYSNIINAKFKCIKCGEEDQDLAERYCGNKGCPHKL